MRLPLERVARYRCLAAAPLETLQVLPGESSLTLLAAGDLALNRFASFEATSVLGDVAPIWNQADVRIANLETVCTSRTKPAGTIGSSLRADPEAVKFVQSARLTAVTVANNHALDFGSDGLAESVERVRGAGVAVCGAAPEPTVPAEPALFTAGGVSFGMIGYCDSHRNPAEEAVHMMPATATPERIQGAIRDLAKKVDIVIVQMHWGYEFIVHPLLRHREMARQFADAGAHIVLCHHAHVPMGIEVWGSSIIAQGLGNWLFEPQKYLISGHDWTQQSFLLQLAISRKGVHSASVVPFGIDKGPQISLLAGNAREFFLRGMSRMSQSLQDSRWLGRVERCRTIFETVQLLSTLPSYSDIELRQRALSLRTPIRVELASALSLFDGKAAQLATVLRDVAARAEHPGMIRRLVASAQTTIALGLEDLRRQYRWQDAFLARVP